jgi:hypothetical protein
MAEPTRDCLHRCGGAHAGLRRISGVGPRRAHPLYQRRVVVNLSLLSFITPVNCLQPTVFTEHRCTVYHSLLSFKLSSYESDAIFAKQPKAISASPSDPRLNLGTAIKYLPAVPPPWRRFNHGAGLPRYFCMSTTCTWSLTGTSTSQLDHRTSSCRSENEQSESSDPNPAATLYRKHPRMARIAIDGRRTSTSLESQCLDRNIAPHHKRSIRRS